jgi:transglycosylase-like protein with SLT domain
MFREIVQLLLAIQLSAPHATPPDVRLNAFATTIQEQAQAVDVDPFIFVAIIAHESQWNERAISGDGLDYGLMQVRHLYYGNSPKLLLNGETNIKAGAYVIKKAKEFCRNYLKREPTDAEWMSVYQGDPRSCRATRLAKKVVNFSLCLQQNVEFGHNYNCKRIYWPEIKNTDEQETYNE